MKESFGFLPDGKETFLYTISGGGITAAATDFGATLVRVLVPDSCGQIADVVLGYDDCNRYRENRGFLGATVGRSGNRLKDASFCLNGKTYHLTANDRGNNLHSGPDNFNVRLWQVLSHTEHAVTFSLFSPDGDQGYPGNAHIQVTYEMDDEGGLHIRYEARCDQDTIFNMTNHSYFNLAGHDHPEAAIDQLLTIHADCYTYADEKNIPTGELRSVAGTPMDFRTPKPVGQDIRSEYSSIVLQGGYDHNWVVNGNPCAVLSDPTSGRTMEVHTDCPGIQFYAGNFLHMEGKGGVFYGFHAGMALETQFWPDALHHPEWAQPITRAGETYHSETVYRFR